MRFRLYKYVYGMGRWMVMGMSRGMGEGWIRVWS